MPEDKKQIVYRGTNEFRVRLQRAALDRNIKVQQLIDDAVEGYLNNGSPPVAPALSPAQRHLIEAVRAFAAHYKDSPEISEGLERALRVKRGTFSEV